MREERDVLLSDKTTLRLGGPARRIVHAESAEEIASVVRGPLRLSLEFPTGHTPSKVVNR